jgi:tight adherence protein C
MVALGALGAAGLAALGASSAGLLAAAAAVCAVLALAVATGRDDTFVAPGERPSGEGSGSTPRRDERFPRLLVVLARLGRTVGGPAAARDAAARIAAAGLDDELSPEDLAAAKGGLVLVVILAVAPLTLDGGAQGLIALVVCAAGALIAPDVVLRRRADRRARRTAEDLADVLDLLRIASGAGLPMTRAMGEVAQRHPGLLAAELGRCAGAVALGVPLGHAVERLKARCPLPAVGALVAAAGRSDRHGVPLAPALAALAADARADRARALADHAARAAPKIQLVVALLLVPSVLLLVAAALLPALGVA